jgi:nucleoside-diphosphate-sugar epimerase
VIWESIRPGTTPSYTHVEAFKHDVRRRVPCVDKARDVLGFEAAVPLSTGLPEVIDWLKARHANQATE